MDLCSFFPLSLPSSPRLNPGNSRPSIKILCSASLPPPPLSFQLPSAASGLAGRPTAVHADGKSRRRSALNRWLRGLALDRVPPSPRERRSCQEGTLPLSSTFESPPPPPPPFGGGSKPLLRVFCLQRFLAAALECFSGRPESPEEGGGGLCQPSSRCPGSREARRTRFRGRGGGRVERGGGGGKTDG